MLLKRTAFSGLTWFASFIALCAILVAVSASWFLYNRTITLLTENLRERLLSISITQAANIRAESLAELRAEEDWQKPEWVDVVRGLKKAKEGNPNIVFMYIFRLKEGSAAEMEFVADAESLNPYANLDADTSNDIDANGDGLIEPDGADKLQWPGQDYPEAVDIPEAFAAYEGPLTATELYEDSYGRVLSGYAPITDNEGKVVAILATDIKADDFLTVTRQTLYPFLVFISGLIAIIAVLSATLVYLWRRRAQMLAILSANLERANVQQEGLLHFISHEVKGFLTKNQAVFASMMEGDYGALSEKLAELTRKALTDTRKGVSTVMDILDASNLKRGTMNYAKKSFDLVEAIKTVIKDQSDLLDIKNLSISARGLENQCFLAGDETKIRRHVIRNLIDNAIRYTPSGTIDVELEKKSDSCQFSVKDSGVGIAPEDMPKLFTEGGHGKDSIKVNVDSTGYGLFVAKQVVEGHGGKIWAESEGAGKGSRFIVELPIT